MKRKFFVVLLSLVCMACLAIGLSACSCSSCNGGNKTHTHTNAAAVKENEIAATCTESGSYDSVIYCSTCNEEISRETVTVPALGHTTSAAVKENEVAATCTVDGLYESVIYCSTCGDELSRETVTVPALGHTSAAAVKENEVAATCTEDGSYDSVIYCSTCGEEISRETVAVPALGHTLVQVEGKAATCTEVGWESYEYCSVCGYTTYKEIAAPGHNYKSEVTLEPTYETTGIRTYTCTNCGDSYTEEIAVLTHAHNYISEVTTAPTCTQNGVLTYTCTICGDKYTESIAATGHTNGAAVKENEVAATCTEDGSYDSVIYCSTCNEEISRETVAVPATGHLYLNKYESDENGHWQVCTACGATTASVSHNFKNGACTVCGYAKAEELAYTLSADGLSYSVSGIGTCTDTTVIIPATYNGLPVTAVAANAFKGNIIIIVIIIANNVTTIGDNAFSGCTSLTTVTIGNSVTTIGSNAFSGCTSATNVTIGSGVTSIGNSAFSGCTSLTEISIPESVTTIGNSAFYGCIKLVIVIILGNAQIGEGAFGGCVLITDIILSEELIAQVYVIIETVFYDSPNLAVIKDTTYAIYHIHELTHYERVEANCGNAGNIEYWYCSVCNKYYSDARGTTEISRADIVITAGSHNFVNNVCTICGTVGLILNGRVYKADGDADMTNNSALVGISITLTSSTGNVYTTLTDSSGSYAIDSLVAGDYILIVSEVGYIELVQNLSITLNVTQNINLVVVEGDETQTGGVSGYATDSTTANAISGITVYVRSGVNNVSGEVVAITTTGTNGAYSLSNLAVGNYTLQFVDERTLEDEDYRYTTGTINVAVISDTTVANQNIVLNNSVTITATSMRIVLTWGSTPRDLDSHLTTSDGAHIYFANKTYSWGNLDVDDTSSYGPETITVNTIEDGVTYTYYVYNFSGGGNYVLSNSGATVTVYVGNTESYTFTVPSGSGSYWTLFTYNSETGFTFINTVSSSVVY